MSRAIANKFMHKPSRIINDDISNNKMSMSEALEKLYGLDED